jgi:cysteine desulfurase
MINFDSNNFSLLSKEVSDAMQESVKICQKHRSKSFGEDQFIKAKIEKARYQIAGLMNAEVQMLLFNGFSQKSDIDLILSLLNLLDIKIVIISESEDEQKTEFLKSLEFNGKVQVKFINNDKIGKIDLNHLSEIVEQNSQRKLITLSHANGNTGDMLPVKEIVSICKLKNAFFHLNANLTIGRYRIDFQKLLPDFMSYGCNLINGPEGIGTIIINRNINIEREAFNLIYNYFQIKENNNLILIAGFEKALNLAYEKLDIYINKISSLKKYFVSKLRQKSDIKILNLENDKKGLVNLIPISLNIENYGKYLKEKLELKGISVDNLCNVSKADKQSSELIVPIALNDQITEADIDYFLLSLDSINKK